MNTPSSPPLNVLVVEDNPDAADSLADLLRLHGHRATVARTARESLEAADREPPDVALLDIRLPDLDGWQVARWLREKARIRDGRQLLLVAVTGCGEDRDRWRSVEVGIDLHLLKPVDPALLTGLLERFGRGVGLATDGTRDKANQAIVARDHQDIERPVRLADVGQFVADTPSDLATGDGHAGASPLEADLAPELLRAVAENTARFGPPALAAIARHYLASCQPACQPAGELSEREAAVLKRIAWGYSNKEIAAKMQVSVKTVETYKARAMEKLQIHTRVELVRYALRQGWLTSA